MGTWLEFIKVSTLNLQCGREVLSGERVGLNKISLLMTISLDERGCQGLGSKALLEEDELVLIDGQWGLGHVEVDGLTASWYSFKKEMRYGDW